MLVLLRLVSLRHFFGAPVRTVLTLLGVALGVATVVGITSINRSVLDAFRSTVDTVAGKADLTVGGSEVGFDEALLDEVRAVPGVHHAAGSLTIIASVPEHPEDSLYILGIDLLDDGYFRAYQGIDTDVSSLNNDLEFLNSTDRLLLARRYAQSHGLKTGDTLWLMTPDGKKPFVVHGLLDDQGPMAAFGGAMAVMFFASAQEAFGRGRMLDRIDIKTDAQGWAPVRDRIQAVIGASLDVDRPERRGESIETMLRSFQLGLNLGSGVALLVGVFLIYNTISIGVVQRRREVGTLRALGVTKRGVRWLFALEALVQGVVGSLLGLPLGITLSRAAIGVVSDSVSSLYVRVNAGQVTLQPTELVVGVVLGVLGSLVAALRPAHAASSVAPVEALRKEPAVGLSFVRVKSWPTLVGLGLWAMAYPLSLIQPPMESVALGGYLSIFAVVFGLALLTPLFVSALSKPLRRPAASLLGVTGQLAADNFARAPGRTAMPVAALCIGVSLSVGISGFVGSFQISALEWIHQAIPADLFVTSSSKIAGTKNQPMQAALGDGLAALAQVKHVSPVRLYQHDVLGLRMYVIAIKSEVYAENARPIVVSGTIPTVAERKAGVVTISENVANRRKLKVGDVLPMRTPTGEHGYPIAAVVVDYTSDQGVIHIDRDVFVRDFKDDRVDSFHIYLKDKRTLEATRAAISERYRATYDVYVLSNAELRDEAMGLIDKAFAVTTAMEIVAVLLALLGVINTLLAAVIDRTREVGLLRAIGAAREHITRLFAAEAALIGLVGSALGVVLGIVTGFIITTAVNLQATGWSFAYHPPWAPGLRLMGIATVCALLAGLYPARRAARLDVVEALAWE